jgi:hypothetical protein
MLSIPPIGEVIQVDGHAYRLLPVADIDQPVLDGLDRLWARIPVELVYQPRVVRSAGT